MPRRGAWLDLRLRPDERDRRRRRRDRPPRRVGLADGRARGVARARPRRRRPADAGDRPLLLQVDLLPRAERRALRDRHASARASRPTSRSSTSASGSRCRPRSSTSASRSSRCSRRCRARARQPRTFRSWSGPGASRTVSAIARRRRRRRCSSSTSRTTTGCRRASPASRFVRAAGQARLELARATGDARRPRPARSPRLRQGRLRAGDARLRCPRLRPAAAGRAACRQAHGQLLLRDGARRHPPESRHRVGCRLRHADPEVLRHDHPLGEGARATAATSSATRSRRSISSAPTGSSSTGTRSPASRFAALQNGFAEVVRLDELEAMLTAPRPAAVA